MSLIFCRPAAAPNPHQYLAHAVVAAISFGGSLNTLVVKRMLERDGGASWLALLILFHMFYMALLHKLLRQRVLQTPRMRGD